MIWWSNGKLGERINKPFQSCVVMEIRWKLHCQPFRYSNSWRSSRKAPTEKLVNMGWILLSCHVRLQNFHIRINFHNCYAEDVLKTSWRHVLKTCWRPKNVCWGLSKVGSLFLPEVFQFKENNVTLRKTTHLLKCDYVHPLRYSTNFKQSDHCKDVVMLVLKLLHYLLHSVNLLFYITQRVSNKFLLI